jgi:hypothetical protein
MVLPCESLDGRLHLAGLYAALSDRLVCAFIEESRIKPANATKLRRKSAVWGTLGSLTRRREQRFACGAREGEYRGKKPQVPPLRFAPPDFL